MILLNFVLHKYLFAGLYLWLYKFSERCKVSICAHFKDSGGKANMKPSTKWHVLCGQRPTE
jgi:hypothetical protein